MTRSRAEENLIVEAVAEWLAAGGVGRPPENVPVNALESLASARAVSLEVVLRAWCRDDLADLVRRPAAPLEERVAGPGRVETSAPTGDVHVGDHQE